MKYIAILLILFPLLVFSQQVENIHFEQVGKQIHIYYDLQGEGIYNVEVFCSTDDGQTWEEPLQKVTGAAGKNQKPGSNKEIIWDVLAEREKLQGNVLFKVKAAIASGIEMVFVKGGTYQMGSKDGYDDEKPVHTVTINDFYIGKYEITQKQWRDVMGNNSSSFSGCDNCPVESVSWNDIKEFIKRLDEKTGLHYRLPTEAEWEYAARGGNQSNGYKYAGSNNIDDVAWYTNNSGSHTHRVGNKSANELGIYDMSGNVWEWCSDRYDANYYGNSLRNNPKGPLIRIKRVLRGGCWGCDADGCRVAGRNRLSPGSTYDNLGFRIVR